MKIENLTGEGFSTFGSVFRERPMLPHLVEEHLTLDAGKRSDKWLSSGSMCIDYDRGMTLLVIFDGAVQRFFYLDRAVSLRPNVVFSLVPLEQSSTVSILRDAGQELALTGSFQVSDMEQLLPRLGFGNILTFFRQKLESGFYFRGEAHGPYEFIYVESGQLHTIVGGHDFVIGSRECFIVGKNEWHIQYSDAAVRFFNISFFADEANMQDITGRVLLLPEKMKTMAEQMVHDKTESPFSDEYVEALFKLILIELIRCAISDAGSEKQPVTGVPENVLVEKALKYIDKNIGNKIKLEDLALRLHISIPYLYELFNTHLHMPPGKYIMRIRIEESKILLRERELTVGEIAQKTGFATIQHFCRQFRNHCGMSPSQYVKSL